MTGGSGACLPCEDDSKEVAPLVSDVKKFPQFVNDRSEVSAVMQSNRRYVLEKLTSGASEDQITFILQCLQDSFLFNKEVDPC
ncbi:hypothetical protein NDU88_004931 [Pleurodeles waltl]|uniref:Uncharacterized protein n=1 Tax=Pleurodeles waltl TaxID=8319 RepID=A0AAV7PFG0_PLEWA|nr:hypothetical protein NDU88_004931 [Pleurodeles waltl]